MKRSNFSSRLPAIVFVLILSNLIKADAQCFESDGVTIRPSFYRIWVVIDQTWIDLFNGNETTARMAAINRTDAAIEALNATTSGFSIPYNFTFFRTFTPALLAPPFTPGGDLTGWCIDVNDFFYNAYPCVRRNAILLFTNQFGNAPHFAYNDVALLAASASPLAISHEIGHLWDLTHLWNGIGTSSNCCKSFNATMMCVPMPNNAKITPVNSACSISVTNHQKCTTNLHQKCTTGIKVN